MPSIAGFKAQAAQLVLKANQSWRGDSLKSKLIRNVGWISVGYGSEIFVRLISSVILTRLLDPSAYGLISTVSIFLTVAVMLSDLGIRTIVQADERGDEKNFLNILWTIQVVRGFILAALLCLAAGAWHLAQVHGWISAASPYRDPLLPGLLLLISTSLIMRGFSSINEYRLIRHLERGAVSRMDIWARIITTVLTVAVVFAWRSVWALALATVIGTAVRTVLTLTMLDGPRMELRFNWGEVRKVLHQGRWIALGSALTVLTMSADKVLIGYKFDLATLGIYSIAMTLFLAATTIINNMNLGMGVAVLRAIADKPPAEKVKAFYRFRLPVDVYCSVAGIGMVLLGPLFFQIAYDPRYLAGGTYLALLGIKVILTPITFSGNFLLAIQRFKLVSAITAVRTVTFLASMGAAVWANSMELMVLAVALERLPEILIYMFMPGTGIPFDWRRDGLLIAIASALLLYLFI